MYPSIFFLLLALPAMLIAQSTLAPPTISIAPDVVYSLDEALYLEGTAPSNSSVRIMFQQPGEQPMIFTVQANANGEWALHERAFLPEGVWEARARAEKDDTESNWSHSRTIRSVVTGIALQGKNIVSFATIAGVLAFLIVVLAGIFGYILIRVRERERRALIEKQDGRIRALEHVERTVEEGFARIKHQLMEELHTIEERSGAAPLSTEDMQRRERILEQLHDIEDDIEKRIHEAQHQT